MLRSKLSRHCLCGKKDLIVQEIIPLDQVITCPEIESQSNYRETVPLALYNIEIECSLTRGRLYSIGDSSARLLTTCEPSLSQKCR